MLLQASAEAAGACTALITSGHLESNLSLSILRISYIDTQAHHFQTKSSSCLQLSQYPFLRDIIANGPPGSRSRVSSCPALLIRSGTSMERLVHICALNFALHTNYAPRACGLFPCQGTFVSFPVSPDSLYSWEKQANKQKKHTKKHKVQQQGATNQESQPGLTHSCSHRALHVSRIYPLHTSNTAYTQ